MAMKEGNKKVFGITFSGGITVNGPMFDIHDNKHVHIGRSAEETADKEGGEAKAVAKERTEELFHFVYPELDETEAWRIHDAVRRVVRLQGVQMICQYLVQLKGEKKVLLPPNPSSVYAELVRMGMPNGEGYNEITFRKYYNKPIAPNAK